MKTRICTVTAAAIVGLALAAPGQSRAELTDRFKYLSLSAAPNGINTNQVEVAYDGEENDWVVPTPAERLVQWRLTVEAETTKKKYKIEAALASVAFQGYAGSKLLYWEESQIQVMPTESVTKLGPKDYVYSYLVSGLLARNACRFMYDELKAQGLSHADILSEDRIYEVDEELFFAVEARKKNDILEKTQAPHNGLPGQMIGHWAWRKVWNAIRVKCLKETEEPETSELEKDPEAPTTPVADDLTIPFHIQKIELALSPKTQSGVCPLELSLKIDVFATAAGVAKVRAMTAGGGSPELKVPVESHPSGAFVGSKIFKVEIGESSAGGFAAVPQPSDVGITLAIEAEDNVHQGVYWIEASNGVKSNNVGYRVTCTASPFEPGLTVDNPNESPRPAGARDTMVFGAPKATTGPNSKHQTALLAKPDLIIKSVRPSSRRALHVLVQNAGGSDAGPTRLRLTYKLRGKTKKRSAAVQAIASGQQHWIRIELDEPAAKLLHATLNLDPRNKIDESNEGNNRYKLP